MGEKQKWWDRLEFVTRNITASMDATDRDVRELADRVAALERSISSDSAGQSADLRTYIYDIVWRELKYDGDDFCGHLADVLIRELPELCARRRCERCRKPCHPDEFPPVRDGSDELRPFCISCTNYIEWTTS